MKQNSSLDGRWWLQFQPTYHNKMNLACEHLNDCKPGVAHADLQSNCMPCPVLDRGQHGIGCDQLLPSTNSKLTECSNIETASQNPADILHPSEVNNNGYAFKAVTETAMNDIGGAFDADISQHCQEVDWVRNKLLDGAELEGSVNYYMDSTTSKSYDKGGIRWRRAHQRELASIVAEKAAEHLQNCDLPPPQVVWLGGGPFKSYDKCVETGMSKPLDINVSTSLDRTEPSHLEDMALHSSNVYGCSPSASFVSLAKELPTAHHSSSANWQERTTSSDNSKSGSDGGTEAVETNYNSKSELLKALHHSQTRARKAEKTAALISLEKEVLLSLFLREASHLFAYQQWLRLLEIEVAQLRSQLKFFQSRDWGDQNFCYCKASRKKKKVMEQDQYFFVDCQDKQVKKGQKPRSWISSSLGLAVTLGLSLASAGLIIGWSNGWILPSL